MQLIIFIAVATVFLTIGMISGRLTWQHRIGGTISLGEEDGEPKINLIIFEKYADHLEDYDYIELKIEKYSKPNTE